MINSILNTCLDLKQDNTNWFAIRTKSRHEKKVYDSLLNLGYEAFLPMEMRWRIWSDRKKRIQTPLIPSFVFIKDPTVSKNPIYNIPGFTNILKLNGKIGEVTATEIKHLELLCSGEDQFESCSTENFSVGDEIEIIAGPFSGLYANAIEDINHYRVLIEIKSLGLGYRVNMPKNKVRKIQ